MSVAELVDETEQPLLPEFERPVLVPPPEMARILGVSPTTLYRWSQLPDFPVHRRGHLVLYPWREVSQFVIKHLGELPGRADLPKSKGKRKRS